MSTRSDTVSLRQSVYVPEHSQTHFSTNVIEIGALVENGNQTLRQCLEFEQWIPKTEMPPELFDWVEESKMLVWKLGSGIKAGTARMETASTQLGETLVACSLALRQIEPHKNSPFVLASTENTMKTYMAQLDKAFQYTTTTVTQMKELVGVEDNSLVSKHGKALMEKSNKLSRIAALKGKAIHQDLLNEYQRAISTKSEQEHKVRRAALEVGDAESTWAKELYRLETLGKVVQLSDREKEEDQEMKDECKRRHRQSMLEWQEAANEKVNIKKSNWFCSSETTHIETEEEKKAHQASKSKLIWQEAVELAEGTAAKHLALREAFADAQKAVALSNTALEEAKKRAIQSLNDYNEAEKELADWDAKLKKAEQTYGMSLRAVMQFQQNLMDLQYRLGNLDTGLTGGMTTNVFHFVIADLEKLARSIQIFQAALRPALEKGLADFKQADAVILNTAMYQMKRLVARSERIAETFHRVADQPIADIHSATPAAIAAAAPPPPPAPLDLEAQAFADVMGE